MAGETPMSEGVATSISEGLIRLFGEPSPSALFSDAIEREGDIIITAVAWERAGGFGFGVGSGPDVDGGSGEGGGGGGVSQGRPVAVIRIGSAGVQVTPVIDFTKIGVTLLLGGIGVWRALRR